MRKIVQECLLQYAIMRQQAKKKLFACPSLNIHWNLHLRYPVQTLESRKHVALIDTSAFHMILKDLTGQPLKLGENMFSV